MVQLKNSFIHQARTCR